MKKILLLGVLVLLLASKAFAYDESWDFSAPAGSTSASTLDTVITDFKKAIAERLDNDHFFDEDNNLANELTVATHRKVTMYNSTVVSSGTANTGILHVEDANSVAELFYMDENSNDVQITSGGALAIGGNGYTLADLTTSNNVSVGNNLTVNGTGAFDGTLNVTGDINLTGNLTVSGTASKYAETRIKGWVRFDGSGTLSVKDSFNVTSVTDNGTGDYTVTWNVDFADANYAIAAAKGAAYLEVGTVAAGSIQLLTYNSSHSASDSSYVSIVAIGDQ